MLRKCVFLSFSLALAVQSATPRASADPPAPAPDEGFGTYTAPKPTIRPHSFTLAECLALAERNHPSLWAARARLAFVHAQLDEAKWTPWFQWNASSAFGIAPQISGTPFYGATPIFAKSITSLQGIQPFLQFDINGVLPLWTFGKISSIREAGEANVRVNEWDLEKFRQQTRLDVRRAYFGLQLARDAKYVVDDAITRLDKAIEGVAGRRAKTNDKSANEIDRLRLETFREEVVARSGEPAKGETFAMAALRFFTGLQTAFDIPDEPLRRPDRPLVAMTQYLSSARLFRPEISMARAGIAARKAMVDYNRAKFFPDLGLGLGATYSVSPSATPQVGAWTGDPWNKFGYYFGFGLRWNLDLLPNAARVAQAESQLEETRALERLAIGGAMVEVENAYGTAVEAKLREEAWDRAEHKSKQWISTVQDMIDLGTREESALLEPLRAYGNARFAHLLALMDLNNAMSSLAQASGWDSAAPTR